MLSHALRVALLCAALLLGACASAPERPATYTVKRGDTLYSIAWRHRLDYHDIARWNGIGRGYVIYPGQVLRLYPSSRPKAAAASRAPTSSSAHARPRAPAKGP